MVWVIMTRRGVSSERRRSSLSCFGSAIDPDLQGQILTLKTQSDPILSLSAS